MTHTTLAKDLTVLQREDFSDLFYDTVYFDDTLASEPWGFPWYSLSDVKLLGETIEEMVSAYIRDYESEWESLQFDAQINYW